MAKQKIQTESATAMNFGEPYTHIKQDIMKMIFINLLRMWNEMRERNGKREQGNMYSHNSPRESLMESCGLVVHTRKQAVSCLWIFGTLTTVQRGIKLSGQIEATRWRNYLNESATYASCKMCVSHNHQRLRSHVQRCFSRCLFALVSSVSKFTNCKINI